MEAYDGSRHGFLEMMRRRLQLAIKEVPERKLFHEYQAVRRRSCAELRGFGAAAKSALRKEIDKPFASQALATEVLRLLQLMCEGHNNEMQELLREQTYNESLDVDLLSSTYELLHALEPKLGGDNADQVCL